MKGREETNRGLKEDLLRRIIEGLLAEADDEEEEEELKERILNQIREHTNKHKKKEKGNIIDFLRRLVKEEVNKKRKRDFKKKIRGMKP